MLSILVLLSNYLRTMEPPTGFLRKYLAQAKDFGNQRGFCEIRDSQTAEFGNDSSDC